MRLRSYVTAVAAVVAIAAPLALAAQSSAPIHIPVILSLTGAGAFPAAGDKRALQMAEQLVNKEGGIGADHRPVSFDITDDASNPQTVVQLQNQISASKVPIMIGPSLTQQCAAVVPLVRDSGPTQYCLSPGINPPAGGFVFSTSTSLRDQVLVAVRYLRLRGLTHMAILSATDATGQEADRSYAIAKSLPENKSVEYVAQEHFNPSDTSVAAQLTRIKAANPQVLLTWTIGGAFFNVLRSMSDVGLNLPVLACNCNMVTTLLDQQKNFIPKDLLFTAPLVYAGETLGKGPVKDAQAKFYAAFKAGGLKPEFTDTLGWDPAMIVLDAIKHLGPSATAQQYREYINTLHGFAGIGGIYDFRDGTQHGIGQNAVVMVRWDKDRTDFSTVSKRNGIPQEAAAHR